MNNIEEKLKQLFKYDSETGIITRIKGTSRVKSMSIVNSKGAKGYIVTQVDGKKHYGHRLAWLLHYGKFPSMSIDHINGDKADNRMCNLREVTVSQNAKNAKTPNDNKSGRIGVCWDGKSNKWLAYIKSQGKSHFLGLYTNKSDAIKSREEAEIKYGFHNNHGRVA